MAITAGLLRMVRDAADKDRRSLPMSRGDLRAAQREKWALYYKPSLSEGIKGKFGGNTSSSVIPPFPTSSISRSFHPPGCPRSTYGATLLMMFKTEQCVPGAIQKGLEASMQEHRSSGREKES